jgi:hypothetical protein
MSARLVRVEVERTPGTVDQDRPRPAHPGEVPIGAETFPAIHAGLERA